MAKMVIETNGKATNFEVSEELAANLAKDPEGIFGIEDYLGDETLESLGYYETEYGESNFAIYSGEGKCLFSSVA